MTEDAPERPAYGAPCNGCGVCFIQEPCPLAVRVFRIGYQSGRCPALEHDAGAYRCGLVVNPGRYAKARAVARGRKALADAAALLVGAGLGCDYRTEASAETDEIRSRMATTVRTRRKDADRAAIAWGVLDGRRRK